MLDTSKLNRRHKAILFTTLLGVGIALMAGEGIEIAVGLAFVGAALAWAVGSNSRIVHGAFVAVGLLLLCGGLIWNWWDYRSQVRYHQQQVAKFEKRIPNLAICYPLLPDLSSGFPVRGEVALQMPDGTIIFNVPPNLTKQKVISVYAMYRKEWFTVLSPWPLRISYWDVLHHIGHFPASELGKITDVSPSETMCPGKYASAPPVGLLMTSRRLAKLLKSYTGYKSIPDQQLVREFIEKYPAWKSAIVEMISVPKGYKLIQPSRPKWFEDAIAANLNPEEVPADEKPGDPPQFDWGDIEFFGLAALPLLAIGLGLIFGVKSSLHPEPPHAK